MGHNEALPIVEDANDDDSIATPHAHFELVAPRAVPARHLPVDVEHENRVLRHQLALSERVELSAQRAADRAEERVAAALQREVTLTARVAFTEGELNRLRTQLAELEAKQKSQTRVRRHLEGLERWGNWIRWALALVGIGAGSLSLWPNSKTDARAARAEAVRSELQDGGDAELLRAIESVREQLQARRAVTLDGYKSLEVFPRFEHRVYDHSLLDPPHANLMANLWQDEDRHSARWSTALIAAIVAILATDRVVVAVRRRRMRRAANEDGLDECAVSPDSPQMVSSPADRVVSLMP